MEKIKLKDIVFTSTLGPLKVVRIMNDLLGCLGLRGSFIAIPESDVIRVQNGDSGNTYVEPEEDEYGFEVDRSYFIMEDGDGDGDDEGDSSGEDSDESSEGEGEEESEDGENETEGDGQDSEDESESEGKPKDENGKPMEPGEGEMKDASEEEQKPDNSDLEGQVGVITGQPKQEETISEYISSGKKKRF